MKEFFRTNRLVLRQWKESDLKPWIDLNSDSEVMQFYDRAMTPQESLASFEKIKEGIKANGYGLWAVETIQDSSFIGYIGISDQNFGFSPGPIKEIGWRLRKSAWGYGYATEGAETVLEWASKNFERIFSVTAKTNIKSQAVMKRIGLIHREDLDFIHPRVQRQDLKNHVVYEYKP